MTGPTDTLGPFFEIASFALAPRRLVLRKKKPIPA